jgi:hypothetical protein
MSTLASLQGADRVRAQAASFGEDFLGQSRRDPKLAQARSEFAGHVCVYPFGRIAKWLVCS